MFRGILEGLDFIKAKVGFLVMLGAVMHVGIDSVSIEPLFLWCLTMAVDVFGGVVFLVLYQCLCGDESLGTSIF